MGEWRRGRSHGRELKKKTRFLSLPTIFLLDFSFFFFFSFQPHVVTLTNYDA